MIPWDDDLDLFVPIKQKAMLINEIDYDQAGTDAAEFIEKT